MQSDEALLEGWRGGDRSAGDELAQRYFAQLYRFFGTRVGDDAEDLVQRTLLDCVAGRDAVRIGFRPYLFRVARNRLVDHVRKRSRRPDFDPHTSAIPDGAASPSSAAARKEEVRLLQRALQTLVLDQQIALGLYYWDGLTTPEIAEVLDVSPHTVRSRLARARDSLRTQIEALATTPQLRASTLEGFETWAKKVGNLAVGS